MDKPCEDLVRCLGVLRDYFYTHLDICKTHYPVLVAGCHLKSDGVDNIYVCLQILWSYGFSYDTLVAFAKDHQN